MTTEKIKEKSNMNCAFLIYPNQLFEECSFIGSNTKVFLIEEPLMFTQYRFHKKKILFHRASMRAYQSYLESKGYHVNYVEYSEIKKTQDIILLLKKENITKVFMHDPVDTWLYQRLATVFSKNTIDFIVYDTPLFLCTKKELDSFFIPIIQKNKKMIMANFYTWQRKRFNVLIESDGKPVGGKWSYDEENRKKLPKGILFPPRPEAVSNIYTEEARLYVEKHFGSNYGDLENFFYPVTHGEAKKWLDHFLNYKLASFGPYEDAFTTDEPFLFHGILSPLLNSGLLTPEYVLKETLAFAKNHTVPIASLEGFVRQLIGWREYIRAVYVYLGTKERTSNYFNATRSIPKSFWDGTTSIPPVDDTIQSTLKFAYAHHIPRLMIMGNFMNLCGFKPDEVYQWFMELYIDAYDWVMVPNVYSMALYADGGLITTKPYISGSAYIIKMSNYKKGEWSLIWDSLFWNFIHKHTQTLSTEGRLGFIGVLYKKMSQEKLDAYQKKAAQFFKNISE